MKFAVWVGDNMAPFLATGKYQGSEHGPLPVEVQKWYEDLFPYDQKYKQSTARFMDELRNMIGNVETRPHDENDKRPRRWGKLTIEYLEKRLKKVWNEDFEFASKPPEVPISDVRFHANK